MSNSETKASRTGKYKPAWIAVAVIAVAVIFFISNNSRTADDAFREAENGRADVSFTPADHPYYYIFTTCWRHDDQLSDVQSTPWRQFENGVKQLAETDKSHPVDLQADRAGAPGSPQTTVTITVHLAGTTPIDKARSHALAVLDFLDRIHPCGV